MAINPKSIDYIRIEVNSGQTMKKIFVRQNDTVARTLAISLVNNGIPVDLSDALFAEILIKKPDGYEADNACVLSGNEVQYTLRSTDINVVGDSTAQILITFDNGTTLLSPSFTITTYMQTVSTKSQKSMNEYTSITQQLVQVNELKNQAETAKNNALTYSNNASASATSASASATLAEGYKDSASGSAAEALSSENASATSEANASTYASNASASASLANTYAGNASASATSASTSATNASTYATNASNSATQASTSATNAKTSEDNAKESEDNASASESSASSSESNASASATLSESWAIGGTGTREGENRNNAKYWCEQAQGAVGGEYLSKTGDASDTYAEFTSTAGTMASGEKISVLFGKTANAISNASTHIASTNNPHSVTKSQVGLGNVDNTSDQNKPISSAQSAVNETTSTKIGDLTSAETTAKSNLVAMINEVNGIAKGVTGATVYQTYSAMVTALNSASKDAFKVGSNIYIGSVGVPDIWIYSVDNDTTSYTYTTDDAIVNAMSTSTYLKIGYFKIAMLETQKVDLTSVLSRLDAIESKLAEMHYPKGAN